MNYKANAISRRLGLVHDVDAAKRSVEKYLNLIASKDARRLMWCIEAAADAVADDIDHEETRLAKYITLEYRDEQFKSRERLSRLQDDFRFLFALKTLASEQVIQRSAADVAAWLHGKKTK